MHLHPPRPTIRLRFGFALGLALPLSVGCAAPPLAAGGAAGAAPSAAAGGSTAAAAASPNLLDCLGITAIGKCVGGGLATLGGLLPVLIPGFNSGFGHLCNTPPVLPINNPANLNSSNPAVAAAAAAMRDEDAAPQKIAALEYLATRGCSSCVPGAEEAMLAGLDDCIESVRFVAATAIYETAGRPCRACKTGSCCSPRIREKLYELGYRVDETTGCPIEPSPRVRRESRLALLACGPDCMLHPVPPKPAEGPDLQVLTPITPRVSAASASVPAPPAQKASRRTATRPGAAAQAR